VKRLLIVIAALVLVGTSACIRSESSQGVQAGGEPVTEKTLPPCPLGALKDAKGPVKVELWEAFVGQAKEYINQLADDFNKSQDKVQVEVRSQGDSYDELLQKFQAGLASEQLPAIALVEDQNLRVMVDTGAVLPAESCQRADKSDFPVLPAVRNYYTIDDVFWPGYVDVSEPVLYYNVNHFKKAGLDSSKPPLTLEALEKTARALKAANVSKKPPLALKMDSWFIESWVNGAGATVVNKNNGRDGIATKATFDNPVTHEVYDWIHKMLDEGLAQAIPDTPGNIDQYLALAQQNSSMTIETSTAATTIKAFLSGDASGVDTGGATGDLSGLVPSAGPFPGVAEPGKVRISGGAFYMTNTVAPEVQAGAWEFMKYMQSTDGQVGWHLVGSYLPTTQAAASDPRVTTFWEDDLAGKMLKTAYQQLLEVDPAKPGPSIGPYPQYDEAVRKSLESMAFDGTSPDDAISEAQDSIQVALDQYIEDNAPN
jgi:sn-glycerol 3-phosphate transport system substrate-binding protein